MKIKFVGLILGGALSVCSSINAASSVTVLSDTNSFAEALNSAEISYDSVYTLPLQAPSSGLYQSFDGSVTIDQVTYNATTLYAYNDGGYGDNIYYLGGEGSDLTLSISGGGYNVIDFGLGLYSGSDSIQITINGDDSTTLTIPGHPESSFIGIIDTETPITSLTFHDVGHPNHEIDILSPSSGKIDLPPVPEPSTMALATLGGLGLVFFGRRKLSK